VSCIITGNNSRVANRMEGGDFKKERRGGLLYCRECASPLFVQWKELQTLCIPFNFCPVIGQITLKGKTLRMTRQ